MVTGAGRGFGSEGAAGSSASDSSGTSASARPRQPAAKHAAATSAVRTRKTWVPPLLAPPPTKSIRCPKMRPLFLALLSLAACGHVNNGKSLVHPALPQAVLGRGFDSLSSRPRGPCVVSGPTASHPRGAVKFVERVFYARTKQEVLRELGFSGGFSLGIFGIGAHAGFESLSRQSQTASTTFAVIQIQVESASDTLRDYRLKKDAAETLRRSGSLAFYEMCGDGFVAAVRQGGYFLGVVALQSVSQTDTRRLSGEAGASFFGIGANAGARTARETFLAKHNARYSIIQEGGDTSGADSVQKLENLDNLLARAERFKRSVSAGNTVATELIVEPYQVTTNRPRRAELWDLTEQRRFLADLAVRHGELEQADAELRERLASRPCASEREKGKLERAQAEYEQSLNDIKKRAEDCVHNPRSRCKERGLDFLVADAHRKKMQLCTQGRPSRDESDVFGGIGVSPPRRAPKPGVDSPCRVWRFASVAVEVSPSKPGGAPWDADGSPPETAFALWLGDRRSNFPTQSSYSTGGSIDDGLVSAGAPVKAVLTDRDAMFDDRIAVITDTVPEILAEGTWTLESGRTSVTLGGRCIE